MSYVEVGFGFDLSLRVCLLVGLVLFLLLLCFFF